jgi:hypothetical protein
MLKSRRDRVVSLGLEDLEGRKLLSTMVLTPGIQGAHIGSVFVEGNHTDAVVPGIVGQHIGMTAGIVGQHIGMTADVIRNNGVGNVTAEVFVTPDLLQRKH